jgi:hypothetical protein
LPLTAEGKFEQVDAVASDPSGTLVMAGGGRGVLLSANAAAWDQQGPRWQNVSLRAFAEEVTLPPTWLLCDGQNEIEVRSGA